MQVNVAGSGSDHTRRDRNRSAQTMKRITSLALAALIGTSGAPALAQSQGDFTLGLGLGWVEPTQDSDTDAGRIDVDGNLRPTITVEYFVADNIGIAKVPSPADGQFSPNAFNWQISTSKNAQNSEQGFLFMLWATSPPTDLWMNTESSGVFSVRQSVWENDDYRSKVGEDYAQVSLESLQEAAPDPFDRKYPQWGQRYSEELQRAIAGQKSAEDAMTQAASVAEDIYSG